MSSLSMQEIVDRAELTQTQLNSKMIKELLNVSLGDEVDSVKTAAAQCDDMEKRYDALDKRSIWSKEHMDDLNRKLDAISRKIEATKNDIDAQSEFIDDKPTRTGVLVYREILKATLDVFGAENMSEAVICKAIEEAGFATWRSIMGPKEKDQNRGAVAVGRRL